MLNFVAIFIVLIVYNSNIVVYCVSCLEDQVCCVEKAFNPLLSNVIPGMRYLFQSLQQVQHYPRDAKSADTRD